MKKCIALLLAAALTVPLAACGSGGGKDENAPVQTLGWFVMEREDGVALDDLSDQETYLVHVYDLIPDESENAELSSFASHYSVTLNETNTYEPMGASFSLGYTDPNDANYFMVASGYALPWEIDEVPAGSDPIRCVSVYKVNTNDLTEDTAGVFTLESSQPYESAPLDCEISFTAEDITPITRFDDVFQVEEDPEAAMISAAYFQRVRSVCNNIITGHLFNNLFSNGLTSYQNGLTMIGGWTEYGVFSVTGLAGMSEEFYGDAFDESQSDIEGLPAFDMEVVQARYPDLPIEEFEAALDSWLTNGPIALEALSAGQDAGEAGDLADAAVQDMKTYGPQILEGYTAHLKGE